MFLLMYEFVTCALLVLFALNAEAKDKDNPDKRDKPAEKAAKKKDTDNPVIIVDAIGKDYNGPVYLVPDGGSTALLLGTAVLVLGIASRHFSVR
jgi:hypothetical protein